MWVCVHSDSYIFAHKRVHQRENEGKKSTRQKKSPATTDCIFHYIWPVVTDICFDVDNIYRTGKKLHQYLASRLQRPTVSFIRTTLICILFADKCLFLLPGDWRPYFRSLMTVYDILRGPPPPSSNRSLFNDYFFLL